jgi:hypothetical protein
LSEEFTQFLYAGILPSQHQLVHIFIIANDEMDDKILITLQQEMSSTGRRNKTLCVSSSMTISNLKQVARDLGAVDGGWLSFENQLLDDDSRTLASYGIVNNSTVAFCHRWPGSSPA